MGSVLSNQNNFKHLYDSLSEKSQPLYLCFILHTKPGHDDQTTKIFNITRVIESKYVNKKNRYALIKAQSDSNLSCVDFCEYSHLVSEKCAQTKFKNPKPQHPLDIYAHAYLNLSWKNATRILIDIDLSSNKTSSHRSPIDSPYRTRLINNYNVKIFEITSLAHLDALLLCLENIEEKRINEKYVLLYKFPKPYSQREEKRFVNASAIRFNATKLSRRYLRDFDVTKLNETVDFVSEWIGSIWIEDVPFAQGKEVYCFKGAILNEKSNKIEPKVFKLGKYKEIDLRINCLAQSIGRYLAKEFSKEIAGKISVSYSEAILINVKETNGQTRTYLVEDFHNFSIFSKFTSNEFLLDAAQYSDDERLLIEFSHWTYMWTGNNLMVVDLQGFKKGNHFYLTDPAIHSSKSQFGTTDLGPNGFGRYFLFHKCCLDENFKRNTSKRIENLSTLSDFQEKCEPAKQNDRSTVEIEPIISKIVSTKDISEVNSEEPKSVPIILENKKSDQVSQTKNILHIKINKNSNSIPIHLIAQKLFIIKQIGLFQEFRQTMRKEVKLVNKLYDLISQAVNEHYTNLINCIKSISPNDKILFRSKEILASVKNSLRVENFKENIYTVYSILISDYLYLFHFYRNKSAMFTYSIVFGLTYKIEVNVGLCCLIYSIMKLYEMFKEYLNVDAKEDIIGCIVNKQLELMFDDNEDYLKQWLPAYKEFILKYGSNGDIRGFNANLKKFFAEYYNIKFL